MTLNELKTLLALNGNERIPYAEEEIFADKNLYVFYLRQLDDYRTPWWRSTTSTMAFSYACNIINGRWPEAEHVIATSPEDAYYYSIAVIKGRWPEAEHIIATDRDFAYWYNEKFGTNI